MTRSCAPSITLAAAAVLVSTATSAQAAGVDAGSLITNTAQATYGDAGGTTTIASNEVVIKVDELLDVTVTTLDPGSVVAGTSQTALTFEITNTGNGPEAFALFANPNVTGNDFTPTIDGIAIDTNGNGVYDPGVDEILSGPETTPVLAADASVVVFVLATAPAGSASGDEAQVELQARSVTGAGTAGTTFAGEGENGSDAVVGLTGADGEALGALRYGVATVQLVKTASIADPFGGTSVVPGSTITYTLTANVSGEGSVSNLVVTDAYPADTTYAANSLTLDGAAQTDAAGDDAAAADAAGISADLGTVTAGTTRIVTFAVTVDQ